MIMKKRAGFGRVAWLAAVAAMAVGYGASAAVSINLDTITTGNLTGDTGSSSPYLNATITDGTLSGNNGVYLSLSCPGLGFNGSASYDHVMAWDFNVSSLSGVTFTQTAKTDSNAGAPSPYFTNPTISTGSFMSDKMDNYNIKFAFSEGGGGGPPDGILGGVEFGHGDSVTYFIKGLTSSSFVVATKNGNPDTYYSAANIDDAPYSWVAGGNASPVPEPTTMIAGALLLLPFGASTVRMLRRR